MTCKEGRHMVRTEDRLCIAGCGFQAATRMANTAMEVNQQGYAILRGDLDIFYEDEDAYARKWWE